MQTDGHWPLGTTITSERGTELTVIGCECGAKPKKPSGRISTQHVWHQTHRRNLRLQPVTYVWNMDDIVGLSDSQYTTVRGHVWSNGRWVQELTNSKLQAAFLAAKGHGVTLQDEVLADIIRAAEETK